MAFDDVSKKRGVQQFQHRPGPNEYKSKSLTADLTTSDDNKLLFKCN